MKKAIIKSRVSKNNNPVLYLQFTGGNEQKDIPQEFNVPDSVLEKEAEIEFDVKNKISKIKVGNIIFEKPGKQNEPKEQSYTSIPTKPLSSFKGNRQSSSEKEKTQPQKGGSGNDITKGSRAPYNFVSLNEKIIPGQPVPDFDSFHNDRHSGYIDLLITNKTPLFIRGNGNDFLKVNDKIIIPGSSIRGMLRNLVEIISWSKIFTDKEKQFAFRNIRDNFYKNKLVEPLSGGIVRIKSKAGWLKSEGVSYYLYPCSEYQVKMPADTNTRSVSLFKVNGYFNRDLTKFVTRPGNIETPLFQYCKIFFNPNKIERFHNKQIGDTMYHLDYNIVEELSKTKNSVSTAEGYVYATGFFGGKHYQWILPPPQSAGIDVTDVVELYKLDENKDKNTDLIKLLNDKEMVPCFYLDNENNIITEIGHTGLFRSLYRNKVRDFSNQENSDKVDMAESIFGTMYNEKKDDFNKGRIEVEDAMLSSPSVADQYDPTLLKSLLSPKPTTFQHYLHQPNGIHTQINNLTNWNSDSIHKKISGFKKYHHRNTEEDEWKKTGEKATVEEESDSPPIKALKPNHKFIGKIRFDNLTKEELGALLFALDLPGENYYYKIGLGKPLGLGSIKVEPALTIIDRKKRYQTLFNAKGQFETEEKKVDDISEYKKMFNDYMLIKLNKSDIKDLWTIERLRDLLTMMDWNNTNNENWNEATRYMKINDPINEYINRPVLPKPSEVVRNTLKKSKQ